MKVDPDTASPIALTATERELIAMYIGRIREARNLLAVSESLTGWWARIIRWASRRNLERAGVVCELGSASLQGLMHCIVERASGAVDSAYRLSEDGALLLPEPKSPSPAPTSPTEQ